MNLLVLCVLCFIWGLLVRSMFYSWKLSRIFKNIKNENPFEDREKTIEDLKWVKENEKSEDPIVLEKIDEIMKRSMEESNKMAISIGKMEVLIQLM